MGESLKIGMIGAGAISGQYLKTISSVKGLQLVAVADLDPSRAEAAATAARDDVRTGTVNELLASDDIDIVLNLTIPAAHSDVALAAIAAGKSVYGEKPLATRTSDASTVLDSARTAGVRVGCAPDTVLGTGVQTARRALEDGLIGRPISATATMVTPGHELWHPNPDFYYQPGGGPLLDMGPYYLSALVTLLGPVGSVVGVSSRTRDTRVIASGERAGTVIPVDVDTHITGILTHESGAVSTLIVTFDAVATHSSNIEIHGETGSMVVPDPNLFEGSVEVYGLGGSEWKHVEPSAGYIRGGRGIGLLDLAMTPIGVEPRAGGELAFHVLDVMESVLRSAEAGMALAIASHVERPPIVPLTKLDRR